MKRVFYSRLCDPMVSFHTKVNAIYSKCLALFDFWAAEKNTHKQHLRVRVDLAFVDLEMSVSLAQKYIWISVSKSFHFAILL